MKTVKEREICPFTFDPVEDCEIARNVEEQLCPFTVDSCSFSRQQLTLNADESVVLHLPNTKREAARNPLKRHLRVIEEQRAFSEKLVLHAAVPTFVINPEHKVIIWNRACEELTGMRADEVIGTEDHWKAFYAHKRPCLADIVVNGDFDTLPDLYSLYGRPDLISEGIHAEGWYPNLNGKRRYIAFDAAPICNSKGELTAAIETLQNITERKRAEEEKEELILRLREAFARIKTLNGLLPICAWCKKIRDDSGCWDQMEAYIEKHSEAQFTHGICPQCLREVESGENE